MEKADFIEQQEEDLSKERKFSNHLKQKYKVRFNDNNNNNTGILSVTLIARAIVMHYDRNEARSIVTQGAIS